MSSVIQMSGFFAIGWAIRKLGYLDIPGFDRLTRIAFDFFIPCLIFDSIVTGLDLNRMHELWVLPALGFGIIALGAVLGLGFKFGLQHRDSPTTRTFIHISAINNFGLLPIFIIEQNSSHEVLAMFFFFNLGSTIGFWTIGILTIGGVTDIRSTTKRLLTPSILCTIFSLIFAALKLGAFVPEPLMKVTQECGSLAVPMVLIALGATLQANLKREWLRDVVWATGLRLFVMPAIFVLLIGLLPLSEDSRYIVTIVAVMPTAVTSTMMARMYDGNPDYATAVTLITTLGSMATIPITLRILGYS